jgi:hypothetical protein
MQEELARNRITMLNLIFKSCWKRAKKKEGFIFNTPAKQDVGLYSRSAGNKHANN